MTFHMLKTLNACHNVFSQNFDTRKLGEITVFYAVIEINGNTDKKKVLKMLNFL